MATLVENAVGQGLAERHSLIGNREVVGHAGIETGLNPSTGLPQSRASLLDPTQAASAVLAADAASKQWGALPFLERARLLLRARALVLERAESLARLIEESQGKPRSEAYAVEILPALECLKHLAENAQEILREQELESQVILFAHKAARVSYVPYGVVLVITPWNYPFFMSLSGISTALAAGNSVVLKPAPATIGVGLEIGAIFKDAGFPDGVLNVVAVSDAVAPTLVENPGVGKVLFVGSVESGKRVMASAAKNLTPVLLELGGKDPAIVSRDADLDQAAKGIVWGAFVNTGQTCVSVERVYVEAPVAEAFVAKVLEEARRLRVGDPSRGDVDLGPLTLERQRSIVESHVADAVARGAKVLLGGAPVPGPGYFYPPTVLTNVDHTMKVMREETFGPVLPIAAVSSLAEAVRLANDSPYGLTASGWTASREVASYLQRELRAGVVTINDCVSSIGEPTAPYGGFEQSGFGRAHGAAGLREMTQTKYLTLDTSRRPMLWWYPYDKAYLGMMAMASRALHSSSLLVRLKSQIGLLAFQRFRKRVSVLNLLKNVDKLF